jgi:hypothetical protein
MSKFLLNLLVQISKSLVNSKIQFLIQKFLFFAFGPADLAAHSALAQPAPLASLLWRAKFILASPASPRVDGVFAEVRFPIWFAPSELAASFSSLCQVSLGCQFRLPPLPADHCHLFSSPPATPRHPTSNLEMPGEVFTPRLDPPPLISPLNPSTSRPTINGIKAITADRFPLLHPGVPLPSHYKRVRSSPRPSPHSPRPQLLASKSATSTPSSASSTDRSPLSPSRVRPSAAPSCNR